MLHNNFSSLHLPQVLVWWSKHKCCHQTGQLGSWMSLIGGLWDHREHCMYLCVRILRGDGGEGVACGELCWVGPAWGYALGGYLAESHLGQVWFAVVLPLVLCVIEVYIINHITQWCNHKNTNLRCRIGNKAARVHRSYRYTSCLLNLWNFAPFGCISAMCWVQLLLSCKSLSYNRL